MRAIHRAWRLPVLLAVVALAGACATASAPESSAGMTSAPSAAPPAVAATATPAPTPPTSPSPAPTPAPEVGLAWEWVGDPDLVTRPHNGSMYGVISGGPGAIAWGYVYGTGPRIWTTTDGLDWTPAAVEAIDDAEPEYPGEVIDVTAGGPGFVAVGTYGRKGGDGATSIAWTSTDGTSWERVPFGPAFERAQMGQVVAWKGGLLAFGCENTSPTDCGADRVWTSPDGLTWTRSAPVFPEGISGFGIVAPAGDRLWGRATSVDDPEPGLLLEDTPRPTRTSSVDGLTWTAETLPVVGIERLHPLPEGLFLTVAGMKPRPDTAPGPAWAATESGVYRSTDGATWEPLAVGNDAGDEIIAVGDTLLMVGGFDIDHPIAWRSTDGGATWAEAPITGDLPKMVTGGGMRSVAALPDGTLVAVGAEVAGHDPSTAAWISRPQPGG